MILQAADSEQRAMYPQPVNTYPPSRSNPGKLVPDGTIPSFQTHVFAPVVTGAPSKKGRYNSTSQVLGMLRSATQSSPR